MSPKVVVVDSCCALNLLATGKELEIVSALDLTLLDTPQAAGEPARLWTPPDADGIRGRDFVSTRSLRDRGLLTTRALDTPELLDAFVTAASQIADADASCIALAGVLKVPLLTDDRKERRIATAMFPGIGSLSTLDMLHDAVHALGWQDDELVRVAANLRWRGNFAPPRRDPRAEWYAFLLAQAGIGGLG